MTRWKVLKREISISGSFVRTLSEKEIKERVELKTDILKCLNWRDIQRRNLCYTEKEFLKFYETREC